MAAATSGRVHEECCTSYRLPENDDLESVTGGTLAQIEELIKKHELETLSKYVCKKKDKDFGKEILEMDLQTRAVRFCDTQENACPAIPFDGIPFIIIGRKILECHQGVDRDLKLKEKRRLERELLSEDDNSFKKRKRRHQETKKKSCPAFIKIRHIVKFPDYMVKEDCKKREKMRISTQIKEQLSQHTIKMQHQFIILLPTEEDHQNHFKGEALQLEPIEIDVSKLPVPTKSTLEIASSTTSDICNQIMSYSHACNDINVLLKLNQELKSSLEFLTMSLDQIDHFIIEDNQFTYIGSTNAT
ncbi:uncharacterized protein LOC126823910 [Patella vulgata]|uniref:uncharacterized protein LOC126823910 n=1 Tax=Patella vulgata TaxID=6465 RepID=UPI00217F8BD3|nr:uncharacterized protein LOC126823910 [Patella vulgata]